MILTVCLNPCTDVTIEVDSLNIGKLNHVKNKTLSFTGKALNVAIGNHDETEGLPVSDITAALILADKADVHKSRVRKNITNVSMENMNIHDRVNLAAERSVIYVDEGNREIVLNIVIDTEKCPVMDYFEIYFKRMQLCRRAADFLERKFVLIINDVRFL